MTNQHHRVDRLSSLLGAGRWAPMLGFMMVCAIVTGCVSLNTPAQDLAWERWRSCDHFATILLDRIELDGRVVVSGAEYEAAAFTECIRRVAAEQVGHGADAGLQATVLIYLRGKHAGTR